MKVKIKYTVLALPLIAAISCAAPKVYQEAVSERDNCQDEREGLLKSNEKLSVENTELQAKLETTQGDIERLKNSHSDEAEDLKRIKSEYNSLSKRYSELQNSHNALVNGSDAEAKKLIKQLDNTQQNLYKKEDQLNMLEAKLDKERRQLQKLSDELSSRNQRLTELENLLKQKDKAVNALRKKVSDALLGFEGQGLTVTKRNGKVYVSLDEKLLFQSGSTNVDAKGVTALKKLAAVLEQNKDINITIEGHTDDVPVVAGSQLKDNWDLSVRRATTIIRILTANSSINPKRLTASGRGEFLPVDPSKTKEARQKNRRTEIILTPNLDEILNILDSQ